MPMLMEFQIYINISETPLLYQRFFIKKFIKIVNRVNQSIRVINITVESVTKQVLKALKLIPIHPKVAWKKSL